MVRGVVLAGLMCTFGGVGQADTLADVRQDLAGLLVELNTLSAELTPSQGPGQLGHASILDKIAAIEFELKRLTRTSERLEFRIEQVVRDGTRRLGDLEFRVCELEETCVFETVGSTLPLGGVPNNADPVAEAPMMITVTEQSDFDTAKISFEMGDIESAAQLIEGFLDTYPAGPLTQSAMLLLGAVKTELGDHKQAARAFLESYSFDTKSVQAGDSLLNLALALNRYGQADAACTTLSEVLLKFPDTSHAMDASSARKELACI